LFRRATCKFGSLSLTRLMAVTTMDF